MIDFEEDSRTPLGTRNGYCLTTPGSLKAKSFPVRIIDGHTSRCM